MVIWKFRLSQGSQWIGMPAGSKFLDVAFQGRNLFLWALVDATESIENVLIRAVPTGLQLPDDLDGSYFVGTAHCQVFEESPYVLHVFKEPKI